MKDGAKKRKIKIWKHLKNKKSKKNLFRRNLRKKKLDFGQSGLRRKTLSHNQI